VVWGATGFTGQLTAECLLRQYGVAGELRWALGGRNAKKLESVRAALARDQGPEAEKLALVVGESRDAASMQALAERTKVVCTTVGPYALYGSELVAACARAGTHYCDLTGEVFWIRRMIDAHHEEARASGARIVPTCGFDSIPSDLGVWFLQREMWARHGHYARDVRLAVGAFRCAASGGTIASMLNMLEEAGEDREVARSMRDPYALNPKGEGAERLGTLDEQMGPAYDDGFEQWTAPFIMAAINTRVVRRSAALSGHVYGEAFRYSESMLMGAGLVGMAKATATSAALAAGMAAASLGPLRRVIARNVPAPGEGPTRAEQEAGFYDLRLRGRGGQPARSLNVRVTGDRDPGYGSTSKMLGESAVCLALDPLGSDGGLLTPATAMGEHLHARLVRNAGLGFEVVD